ncbi:Methyltransferase domain-containing protein [Thermoflexus hugenholtzii JAD2]|uniref:Methyltransferase domain-containing protein n=2 Tax=Thermoflexus TaxID=1495649 RepID=A0A212PZ32_9CHLR|nr:Methyltransferase domain-containing protein [Thermoflexus hugenholtzii JAD2]
MRMINPIEAHNRLQQEYFGRRIKPTMRPERTPYVLRQVEEVIRFGDLRPGEVILDVGCGMGRHAFLLAERGFRVEGLELSPFLIERMREFDGGRYNIPVYCADIHCCPPELHGRYDALVGFFVLHHLADLPQAFRSMARLLRPGGRVVFLEPNPLNPLYYIQILITPGMSWSAERGILNMRPHQISRAMEQAGLRLTATARYGFFPPFLSNHPWGGLLERILEKALLWRPFLPFQLFRGEPR